MKLFYLFVLLLLICYVSAKTKSKSVTTLLEAKWERTPLVLEVAEFLADENPEFYWNYIDLITDLHPPLSKIGKNNFEFMASRSQREYS